MVARTQNLHGLEALLRQFPVVAILGARQVGKTTLARQLVARHRGATTSFDLEIAEDLVQLAGCPAGPRTAPRNHRARRSAAPAGPLHRATRPSRSAAGPATVPGSGQRCTRAPAPNLGDARRAHRVPRVERVLVGRGWGAPVARALAAWWLSPLLPRALGRREHALAAPVGPHLPRARSAGIRPADSIGHHAAILDDAGSLPRPEVECLGARARVRGGPHDGTPLPRRSVGELHGAPARTMAREHRQASGEVAEGLRSGQRPAAHAARSRVRPADRLAPKGRGLVGGVRARRRDHASRRRTRGVLLLGDALGRASWTFSSCGVGNGWGSNSSAARRPTSPARCTWP